MDLRVYVDGVARIICDLTRTTTVHDIIIALAQYKGKAGRYSLVQRTPDGTQQTLSANQLICELVHHPDWTYILQQTPAIQKRSSSLDGRKPFVDKYSPVTSSTDHLRTVTLSSPTKKRSNLSQVFPLIPSPSPSKRLIRTPKHVPFRSRSTIPTENTPFRNTNHQDYENLLQLLRQQKLQLNQQEQDLQDKQEEINYRENILHQSKIYQDKLQHELKHLEERDRQLYLECQTFTQECTPEQFDREIQYHQHLQADFQCLQDQLTRCSTTFEQKKQLKDQLQFNIDQIREELQQLQIGINNDKQDMIQSKCNLERTNSTIKQQENLSEILIKRNEDIEQLIQKNQKEILRLELELMNLDDVLVNYSSYHFSPTSSDVVSPNQVQLMNSTLLKLCPSGIWV